MIDALTRLLKKELQAELSVILSRNAASKTAEKLAGTLAVRVFELVNKKLHGAISEPEEVVAPAEPVPEPPPEEPLL